MTRRIELDAGEVRPAIDEVLKHLETGALDELVVTRQGRPVARLTAVEPGFPDSLPARPAFYGREGRGRVRRSSGGGGMRRFLTTVVMLAVIGAGVAFFGAPAVAFFALRSAAQSQDVQGLAELVDFNAVRASLRPQLSDHPDAMTPAPSLMQDPIGAIRRHLEQGQAAPDVNAYLTPEAMAGLTYGEGRYASERTRAGVALATPESRFGEPWPEPRYWGVNRVRLAVADAGGSETAFTFERKGLFTWKLVHIGLPDGAAPGGPAPAPEVTPDAG